MISKSIAIQIGSFIYTLYILHCNSRNALFLRLKFRPVLFFSMLPRNVQVVFDLREEFGFSLLQYNQNYQFDTLRCDQVSSIDELEPGDLIFYRAQYYHPERFMNQAHGLVHVGINVDVYFSL